MPSINDLLQDESIRHQVALRGYTSGVLQRIMAMLNASDRQIAAELAVALSEMSASALDMEQLDALLANIRDMSAEIYKELGEALTKELQSLVEYEVSYQTEMLLAHVPEGVKVAAINAQQVYAAARARPFQGVLLKEVWKDLDAAKMRKVRQSIAQGYVEGKTADQIIRELRGTKANGYADGLLESTRRDVAAVVRTAIGHTAGFAQDRVMEANVDLIKALQWSSTLDARTSSPCRIRDRKLYRPDTHKPVGHKIPWGSGPGRLHWNCRSGQVPILKSNKELGIDVPEIVMGDRQRASMDGQVPAETSYADWLKRQSAARQDAVLGPTRGRLLRDGKLSMADMYSARGELLSLDELRKRDAEAFKPG